MELPKLRAEYFYTSIVSLVLSVIAVIAILRLTGIYLTAAPWPLDKLATMFLLLAFTYLSSRFVYRFTKDDAAGIAISFAAVIVGFFAAMILFFYWRAPQAAYETARYYLTGETAFSLGFFVLVYYFFLLLIMEEPKHHLKPKR